MNAVTLPSEEEIREMYTLDKYPLCVRVWDQVLEKYDYVYNFEDKTNSRIVYEILALPLPNGNKHMLLMEQIK